MSDLESELRKSLNIKQFQAATHVNGPAVIMAGAGSGKTHTLISRVAYLIDKGADPERILMLTFTNAAADEMKNRAAAMLDSRCGKITACTYHKFCNILLRHYGHLINMKDYSILTGQEFRNMIKYVKSSNALFDNLRGFPNAGMIANIISVSINKQLSIRTVMEQDSRYDKYRDFHAEVQMLSDLVQDYGFREKKLTYDGLLTYANELLDIESVCRAVAGKYEYIMVDEFQDTNDLQESILLKIAEYNSNIVVVGDISQSIYAFRGANVLNLQSFDTKLSGCKTIVLDYNYRSTKQVLDAANDVMRKNVKSWRYFDMVSPDKTGNKPILHRPVDTVKETDYVIDMINHFHDDCKIPYSDISVLVRGSYSSFGVESVISGKGIAYRKLGGLKFMEYAAVGDMLSYFSIITNPHDVLSWFHVLQLHADIGEKYAKKVADGCREPGFPAEDKYRSRKFYSELQSLKIHYEKFRQIDDFMSLFDAVADFYFDTRQRALDNSSRNSDSRDEEQQSIDNDRLVVSQLKVMASKYDTVLHFMDDITLDSVTEEDDDTDRLTISTIHSAKGLEWDVVIVMDCMDGVFPKVDAAKLGGPEDEEELRCFYVAMTRAKRHLVLVSPSMMMTGAGIEQMRMSHYLVGSVPEFVYSEDGIREIQ
jgi:DNA helicase-2/ATP-dependent DNA helicase PcrA